MPLKQKCMVKLQMCGISFLLSGLCEVSSKVTNLDFLLKPIANHIRDLVSENSMRY